jgi:uncharacterized metal-binding protein
MYEVLIFIAGMLMPMVMHILAAWADSIVERIKEKKNG